MPHHQCQCRICGRFAYDMYAPMDAPIRAREAREQAEHEAAMAAYQTPEFKAALTKICLEAMRAAALSAPGTAAGTKDDPNAPFRWICIHCTTVNAVDIDVCVGCRKPRTLASVATPADAKGEGK